MKILLVYDDFLIKMVVGVDVGYSVGIRVVEFSVGGEQRAERVYRLAFDEFAEFLDFFFWRDVVQSRIVGEGAALFYDAFHFFADYLSVGRYYLLRCCVYESVVGIVDEDIYDNACRPYQQYSDRQHDANYSP